MESNGVKKCPDTGQDCSLYCGSDLCAIQEQTTFKRPRVESKIVFEDTFSAELKVIDALHAVPPASWPAPLPVDSKARKDIPLVRGVIDYFPAALAAIARLSKSGNDKHNPGQDLHWSRGKSADHADCLVRHLVERGTIDPGSGLSHTVSVAWRALALLQEEEEANGAPKARAAR